MVDPFDAARVATSQRRWRDAFDAYSSMETTDAFEVDDLERFALAAQLIGQDEVAAEIWERAHLNLLSAGDLPRAVRCAFWLAFGLLNAGRMSQAGGWC